jgi:hypothetical protein
MIPFLINRAIDFEKIGDRRTAVLIIECLFKEGTNKIKEVMRKKKDILFLFGKLCGYYSP